MMRLAGLAGGAVMDENVREPADPPVLGFSGGKFDAFSQTAVNFFSDLSESPLAADLPSDLSGSGSTLFSHYQANLQYYFDRLDSHSLSEYREEVFNRIRQQSIFQSKVFGHASPNYNRLPLNSFAGFAVSPYLVICSDRFVFSSATPGFEVSGGLDQELANLLGYFDQQTLPPQLLETLKRLNLVWYDGGLICEIADQRRQSDRPLRIHLRVHPDDFVAAGFEIEQEYLFDRFPLLCLDSSIQVSKVARAAGREKGKWKPPPYAIETPAAFMQTEYPGLFIEEPETRRPRVRKPSAATDEELRQRLMKKFGLA
jgi:hypothetical protein